MNVDRSYAYLTSTDQVHDTPEGAMVTAQAIQSFLHTIIPARDDRFTLLGDVFDATNNPTGNLIPNGLMTGISGAYGGGAQGYLPTGWHGDGNDGGANAVAIFSATTPYPNCPGLTKTTMALGGTWTDPSTPPLGYRTPSLGYTLTTGFSAGDTVVGEIEADWNITNAAVQSIYLAVYFQNGGSVLNSISDGFNSGLGPWLTGTGSAVFRTEPFKVPATTNLITLFGFVWVATGPVSAVVNWSRASLRKVS